MYKKHSILDHINLIILEVYDLVHLVLAPINLITPVPHSSAAKIPLVVRKETCNGLLRAVILHVKMDKFHMICPLLTYTRTSNPKILQNLTLD